MRVPLLTPKWQEEEWKSVGRILVKGFQDHGYFPCRLAPAFTVALVFGEHSVSPDLLFESFLFYISPEERDLVNKALLDDLLGDEHDELIDLLDRMGAKSIPTRENLKAVLLNVAHKLIIQQPTYALDKMSQVARTTFAHAFRSQLNIVEMYENMKPTARKVLKLFEASPATQAESQSLRYLQQYVRGLDQAGLRKFLRFTTGSDVLCIKNIEVLFTSLDGVARRPVAHTCGPVLELPWTYLSFPELRVEFDSILSSQRCFDMDIV
uniref:Si:ch73-30l9.1 n=1 Tax=Nothobranchius pienaari TaxID=704102 RepID=A0A1A8L2M6_9TELE